MVRLVALAVVMVERMAVAERWAVWEAREASRVAATVVAVTGAAVKVEVASAVEVMVETKAGSLGVGWVAAAQEAASAKESQEAEEHSRPVEPVAAATVARTAEMGVARVAAATEKEVEAKVLAAMQRPPMQKL